MVGSKTVPCLTCILPQMTKHTIAISHLRERHIYSLHVGLAKVNSRGGSHVGLHCHIGGPLSLVIRDWQASMQIGPGVPESKSPGVQESNSPKVQKSMSWGDRFVNNILV